MKTRLILIYIIAFATNIIAQNPIKTEPFEKPINKGKWQIGGEITGSYDESTVYNNNTSNYSIGDDWEFKTLFLEVSPSIGKFISNGLVIGINPSLSYGGSFSKNSGSPSIGIGLGGYTKYYFNNGFLLNALAGIGKYDASFSFYNGFYLGGGVGYAYFLNPHVSLEGIINYSHQRTLMTKQKISQSNTCTFSAGLHFFFGRK
ncbi:MAG: outer membrane beta-barrel protein [Bacteroidetes bacterium]|nr:outer membrane beta-barrel protein [Bacteroidota bacterium]